MTDEIEFQPRESEPRTKDCEVRVIDEVEITSIDLAAGTVDSGIVRSHWEERKPS